MDLRCPPNMLCNLSDVIITCKKKFSPNNGQILPISKIFFQNCLIFLIQEDPHIFFSFMSGLQQIWINFLLDDRQFGYLTKLRIKILNLGINEFCGLKTFAIFFTFLGLLLEFALEFFLTPYFPFCLKECQNSLENTITMEVFVQWHFI